MIREFLIKLLARAEGRANAICKDVASMQSQGCVESIAVKEGLVALLSHCDPDVRAALAASPACLPAICEILDADTCTEVRYCLAENAACPGYVLCELAHDQNEYVSERALRTLRKRGVNGDVRAGPHAIEPSDSDDIRFTSSQDGAETAENLHPKPQVAQESERERVAIEWLIKAAEHPSAEPELLQFLSLLPNTEVRMAVTDHRNVSYRILKKLAGDPDTDVRFAVAENHNVPLEILEFLSNDDNPYVAVRAERTLFRVRQRQPVQTDAFGQRPQPGQRANL